MGRPHWAWRLALLLGCCLRGGAQFPDPSACANDICYAVMDFTNIYNQIAQAAADCTLPGLDELACSSDLTGLFNYLFELTAKISSSVLTCGGIGNLCAFNVNTALCDFSFTAQNLVAAAVDCLSGPFLCTYDVLTAVDAMDSAIQDILGALQTCDTPYVPYKYTPVDASVIPSGAAGYATGRGVPLGGAVMSRPIIDTGGRPPIITGGWYGMYGPGEAGQLPAPGVRRLQERSQAALGGNATRGAPPGSLAAAAPATLVAGSPPPGNTADLEEVRAGLRASHRRLHAELQALKDSLAVMGSQDRPPIDGRGAAPAPLIV